MHSSEPPAHSAEGRQECEHDDAERLPPPNCTRAIQPARRRCGESAAVPMPVMIRYLLEYTSIDLSDELRRLAVPTHVLVPAFDSTIFNDSTQVYVKPFFTDAWQKVRTLNPRIEIQPVPDARIFVTDDQPTVVSAAISDLAARVARTRVP